MRAGRHRQPPRRRGHRRPADAAPHQARRRRCVPRRAGHAAPAPPRRPGVLQPTVVLAEPEHVLARTEYGFPYVSVVEVPEDELVSFLGPTLVVTASRKTRAASALMRARHIDRLHRGGVPTTSIAGTSPTRATCSSGCSDVGPAGGVFTTTRRVMSERPPVQRGLTVPWQIVARDHLVLC